MNPLSTEDTLAPCGNTPTKPLRRKTGRPTLYTDELASRLADHISAGLTDEEAAALEGISADCITRWRKANPEFCGTIKRAEAQRLKARLARIERGEPGWQGTAWALERIYPKRFSRPDIQLAQQINVGTNSPGELIVDEKLLEQLTAGYLELHGGAGKAS
jgi:hypothetical protein